MTAPSYPYKTGILLVQTGTPDEATPEAVKKYLREFLSDERVIAVNRYLWFVILNLFILKTRPKKSTQLYQRLFAKHGPILRTLCQSLTQKLGQVFVQEGLPILVRCGMRYGNPALKEIFAEMADKCEEILVVPLFPQFSFATTGSIYDQIMKSCANLSPYPKIKFMAPFYHRQEYLDSLCHLIEQALQKRKVLPEQLIFSYHGLPQRYVDQGDPYLGMCNETTELILRRIDFPRERTLQSFQSRLGKEPWLKPYTDQTLIKLAQEQIRDVMIVCPSFTMDCLETLDEIEVEYKRLFRESGGETLELITCLNDNEHWVKNLSELLKREI